MANTGEYSIGTFGGWQKVVEDFLYRNYIKFSVALVEPERAFSGGQRAHFKFDDLTDKEAGLVEGFFAGLKSASEMLR